MLFNVDKAEEQLKDEDDLRKSSTLHDDSMLTTCQLDRKEVSRIRALSKCSSTGQTATFLTFGRELCTDDEVQNDLRSVILKDSFVPEITPYLKRFSKFMAEAKEVAEIQHDLRKECGDRKRRRAPNYFPGDPVFVTTHHLSNAAKRRTTKFMPKRDGPYIILHFLCNRQTRQSK
ncbi:hypothetical protein AVEN_195231-1 [Araneus ventricosus]|uniref:Uncharacterized protein n=1 Tax=Araneus ventricosus TaxID=182803 RepID=A0A4Y2VX21_ARAVE|nr:hypothetical protein AVEN_195231-1 [Araneus ventricosus]